jgi:uncharacterized protein YjbI with pentapeptide repeats
MRRFFLFFIFSFLSAQLFSTNKPDTIVQAKMDSASYYSLQKTKTEILKLKEETNIISKSNRFSISAFLSEYGKFFTILIGFLSVAAAHWKYTDEQKHQKKVESEQQKKDLELRIKEKNIRLEENLASIITNLGSVNSSLRASAAISLISYCKDEYKAFHEQVILICIANLKLDLDETTNRLLVNSLENAIKAYIKEKPLKTLNIKLTRLKLDTIDLSGQNLEGVDLAFSSLRFANLSNAKLRRMRGYKTDFFGANLSGANLQEARLQKAIFEKARMHDANLISADLKHSNLKNCKFNAAQMQSAHFQSADLSGAEFNKADISDAYFLDLASDIIIKIRKVKKCANTHFL